MSGEAPHALVLAGGNALGAYLAGASAALLGAGEKVDWVAGVSIGAITAALIAGNPPGLRVERLRRWWERAATPDPVPLLPRASQWTASIASRLLGRPALFHTRLPGLPADAPEEAGIYDAGPMRALIEALIDFDLLNSGATRLSVLAVDLATGLETVFDTTRQRIGTEHLMASAAMIPDFPPVRIGGRLYVDGGLAANLPLDLVMNDGGWHTLRCFTVDPFVLRAPVPDSVPGMAMRQTDLMFAGQSARTLAAMRAREAARPAPRRADIIQVAYANQGRETAMKGWDYSQSALRHRWQEGERDAAAALARFRAAPPGTGLVVHAAPERG